MRLGGLLVFVLPAVAAAAPPGPVTPDWTVDSGEEVRVPPPPPPSTSASASASASDSASASASDSAVVPDSPDSGFHLSLDGYYRARTYLLGEQIYPGRAEGEEAKRTLAYVTQRLRLQPEIGYGEWATLHVTADCLDNLIWGDNAGLSSTALFASEPSQTGLLGAEMPYVYVRHAWLESVLPIGVLRVGRMPSDWGLGLLSDDGEGFDDDFGDNSYGTTYDRILFATKPISIVRAIAGMEAEDTPLVLVVAWDKLVESFLELDRTGRPVRPRAPYDTGWLADDSDDVEEWTVGVVWHQENLGWLGPDDSLTAGYSFVYRTQEVSGSRVYIHDAYFKLRLWDMFLDGELFAIHGRTWSIPLGVESIDGLYPRKDADILGWLVRTGWSRWMFTVKAEAGFASGDDFDADEPNFSSMPLGPDVNVGLILYEEYLAQLTRRRWRDNEGMWSKGGVYNSYYFMLTAIVEPVEDLQVTVAVLNAWAGQPCDSVYQGIECAGPDDHPWLGLEVDASVRYRFYDDHMLAVLEGGWYRPDNEAFRLDAQGFGDTDIWTLQSRIAFVF